jgi:hypothetical protein
MATCAILGQALGTAVAQAIKSNRAIENVDIGELQQTLMADDCYIPWHKREVPKEVKIARCNADVVRNGIERGEENCWIGKNGDVLEYTFEGDRRIREIRLVFDNDMNRKYHNMPCNYPLTETRFFLPKTLIKEYRIEGISESGERFDLYVSDNHQRFVRHAVDWKICKLRFVPVSTNGCEEFRVFDFEFKA